MLLKMQYLQFDVELDFDYIGVAVQDHGLYGRNGRSKFPVHEDKGKIKYPSKSRGICLS